MHMNRMSAGAAAAAMLVALTAPVHAGKTAAGPAATASLATGTVVTPQGLAEAVFGTVAPGTTASIGISSDQAAQITTYLASQPGAVVSGSTVSATGTFADGTRFVITIDSATGTLSLTRGVTSFLSDASIKYSNER